jgi:hypothetical protein
VEYGASLIGQCVLGTDVFMVGLIF